MERDGVVAEDHPGEHENVEERRREVGNSEQEEVLGLRASLSQDWKQVLLFPLHLNA